MSTHVRIATDRNTGPSDETELLHVDDPVHRRRWAVLAIVCLAVFVSVIDGTIVNIAIPTLAVDLDANTRQLQRIVDASLLVFTGLLLAAGGLGDRYGRKKTLIAGLVLFAMTSASAGSSGSRSTRRSGTGIHHPGRRRIPHWDARSLLHQRAVTLIGALFASRFIPARAAT